MDICCPEIMDDLTWGRIVKNLFHAPKLGFLGSKHMDFFKTYSDDWDSRSNVCQKSDACEFTVYLLSKTSQAFDKETSYHHHKVSAADQLLIRTRISL